MRVLVVHNRYRSATPSGENRVVEREIAELQRRDVDVATYLRSSDEIEMMPVRSRAGVALGPIRAPRARQDLARLLDTFRPDVVHVHNVFPLVSPAIIDQVHAGGIPVVHTAHSHALTCIKGRLFRDGRYCDDCVGRAFPYPGVVHGCYRGSRAQSAAMATGRWAHRRTWRSVDRVLAISGFQRDRLVEGGFDPARIAVKHNFVPDPGPPEVPAPERDRIVVFASRLEREKGTEALLDAWRRARLPAPWRLVVVGDGECRTLAERHAHEDTSIEMAGLLSADAVAALLARAAAAVVATSAPDPGPLAVPEALAHGTPVVAVDTGGVGELVGDGGTVCRPEALARTLARVPEMDLARIGARARSRYEHLFAPDVVMPQLIATYAEVVASRDDSTSS